MNTNSYWSELVISVVLMLLLILSANPFGIWMPSAMAMTITAGVILLFGLFATFIWRERPADEREALHRMIASRTGFLAGALVLVCGIAWQTWQHAHDSWLPVALAAMILGKILGSLWARWRK